MIFDDVHCETAMQNARGADTLSAILVYIIYKVERCGEPLLPSTFTIQYNITIVKRNVLKLRAIFLLDQASSPFPAQCVGKKDWNKTK